MSKDIKQIRQKTIYTMSDFDAAKTFASLEENAVLSSPEYGVYEVIIETVIYIQDQKS